MRSVRVVGIGQIPVQKNSPETLRRMGAEAVRLAMADAGVEQVDALFAGNMLADELQHQKHIAALIADEALLVGVEALHVRAATATGAAALRMAYFAVASGEAELAVAVGVEKMSTMAPTAALAKALDARKEVRDGATLISHNALLMRLYMECYDVPYEGFANFAVNAHRNAATNPFALFREPVTIEAVLGSRLISPPLRLFDCSPICDGAAAVVLGPTGRVRAPNGSIRILASAVATDRFRLADRSAPLALEASRLSARKAFERAGVSVHAVDFFEVHDAFSIMACLQLEACGFAPPGHGWRMAAEGEITLEGRLPICTLGGLKARGHPIGATALYQTAEIVQQFRGTAGPNQLSEPHVAMLQSVGGAATTVLTHVFAA